MVSPAVKKVSTESELAAELEPAAEPTLATELAEMLFCPSVNFIARPSVLPETVRRKLPLQQKIP